MIHEINLLPRKEPAITAKKLILIIAAAVWLLVMILLVVSFFSHKSDILVLNSEQSRLTTELALLNSAEPAVLTEGSNYSTALNEAGELDNVVSVYLKELVRYLPENGYLIQFEWNEDLLVVQHQFETLNHATSYISGIKESDKFSNVAVEKLESYFPGNEPEDFDQIPRYLVTLHLTILEEEETDGAE
ncbi:hypothetical protein [Jeotgalibacillus sp. R-1-5s-1]|uniref:hypothetical protein n=1 Tax=Jeotgalibacillus sp. R-1-5s-1 TaxID=2555897 RepID=UPI00106A2EA2|nr:hypothetical protein [Jeotgalibacillus sp. R-1-5s-1]TFD92421.1 hypothetical protein E2491_16705 [Jeotgalibacillus sp. R-1-5s-1]